MTTLLVDFLIKLWVLFLQKMLNGVSSISIMRPKKTGLELAEEDKAKGRVTQWNSVDEMFDTVLGE